MNHGAKDMHGYIGYRILAMLTNLRNIDRMSAFASAWFMWASGGKVFFVEAPSA